MQYLTKQVQSYLVTYLTRVLEIYQRSRVGTNNELQRKLLCTWIVELKLSKINNYKATINNQVR
jgi:hypothetical protein